MQWWKDEKCLAELEQFGLPRNNLDDSKLMKDKLLRDFSVVKHSAEILEESGITVTLVNIVR